MAYGALLYSFTIRVIFVSFFGFLFFIFYFYFTLFFSFLFLFFFILFYLSPLLQQQLAMPTCPLTTRMLHAVSTSVF